MSADDPSRLFSIGTGYINSAYRIQTSLTTNGGAIWLRDTFSYSSHGYAAVFDRERLFIGGDSVGLPLLGVSTDLGATWANLRNGLSGPVYSIAPTPDPDLLYCGTTQGVYRTTDAGLSWARKGTMSLVKAVCADEVSPSIVYAGTASGVYASTDAGETWQPFSTGLGNTDVLSLALRSGPGGKLLCGTNGASVFATDALTGLAEQPHAPRPSPFALWPNPARAGRVFIRLSAPDHWATALLDHVRIGICDASGRCVLRSSIDTQTSSVPLDLGSMRPGIYFVRLASSVQKLIVQP